MKGQRMLAIVSVAAVLGGARSRGHRTRAQPPDTPTGRPAPEPERPLGDDEAMVLNFERADIREVIHSLATALGISYTLDPRIEGQVTIRTTGQDLAPRAVPALQPDPPPERHRRRAAPGDCTRSCRSPRPRPAPSSRAARRPSALRGATTTSSSRSSRCATCWRTRWRTSSSRSSRRAATCCPIRAPTRSS